jgi:hypothetical protein
VEKQIGGGFFSRTRSWEPRETMRNAAKGCGEGGVVCDAFYRVAGGKVRGRRRPAVVDFYPTVLTLNRGGESMRHRASAGEGRRSGGGLIRLRPSAGGRRTVACGAVATSRTGGGGSGGRWKTALGDGPNGPVRLNGPAWQLGWLSIFGPKIRI